MRKPRTHSGIKVVSPFSIALIGILASSHAQAQLAPVPNAGSLLNQQQQTAPVPRPPQSTTPGELGISQEEAQPQPGEESALTVVVKAVRFDGDTELATKEDLQAVVSAVIGKRLTHAGLQKVADTITQYLRGRGYMVAYAYLAPQDLTDGNLVITLVAGRLESDKERIIVQGQTRSSPERLAAIAAAALPTDRPLTKKDLERALLLINDQPGISARATLERGSTPGSSKLLINATPGPVVQGQLTADNYGDRSTGAERGTATIVVNDPLKIGDQLIAGFSKTEGTEVASLSYSLPLTPQGLSLLLGGSYLHYRVTQDSYSALDLRGEAVTGSVGLNYPIIRSRAENLNFSTLYEHKHLNDNAVGINLSKRDLDDVSFSLFGNRFDGVLAGGLNEGRVSLKFGRANLSGNSVDEIADSLSARTAGNYTILTANASRLQMLDSNWSVYGGIAAQLANQNLDSSEKFLLGGPTGVRGYPIGEASGDEGWLGTLELRRYVNIGLPQVKVQALGFVDAGQIRLHHTGYVGSDLNQDHTNSYFLTSAGVGVNVWSGRWNAHAAVARTIGRNPGASLTGANADGLSTDWRAWLQLSMTF